MSFGMTKMTKNILIDNHYDTNYRLTGSERSSYTVQDAKWNTEICLVPPANEVCEGYVFTGVCLSTGGSLSRGDPLSSVVGVSVYVRILLECILVKLCAKTYSYFWLAGEGPSGSDDRLPGASNLHGRTAAHLPLF